MYKLRGVQNNHVYPIDMHNAALYFKDAPLETPVFAGVPL